MISLRVSSLLEFHNLFVQFLKTCAAKPSVVQDLLALDRDFFFQKLVWDCFVFYMCSSTYVKQSFIFLAWATGIT